MDETGFGIKYENNLSAYIPPHWHKDAELLMFVKGRVTCNFVEIAERHGFRDPKMLNSYFREVTSDDPVSDLEEKE